MTSNLAPIVLFCYNRPWHVEQTLIALSKNEMADQSVLYIYCDGPKENATAEQISKIQLTRKAVRKEKWCKEVYIIEAERNKGLANSIIDGVTQIVNKYGKVIVLEDDLVSSPYFLIYMNHSLETYECNKGVFSIGAYNFPITKLQIPEDYKWDNYASLRVCSWGWATWKDRWQKVCWDIDKVYSSLSNSDLIESFNRAGDDFYKMLSLQFNKEIDSWAIRFAYAHFYNHAVAMCPIYSYIDNLGLDGSGVHCSEIYEQYKNNLMLSPRTLHLLDVVYEDKRIINGVYNINSKVKRPLWQKVINFIARNLGNKPLFVIKKKIYA